MPTVHFSSSTGEQMSVEFEPGISLMHLATSNLVPGVEASCGGFCSCATCHVYIDPAWADKLPPISPDENDLLEGTAAERRPNSRLSCQVTLTDELDQLRVETPDRQS